MTKKSKQEVDATLNLAKDINENFPFLKGRYKIFSNIKIDSNGNEVGALGIEIVSSVTSKKPVSMQVTLNKYLDKILTKNIKKQNDSLRKENKELKTKLQKCKVDSKAVKSK